MTDIATIRFDNTLLLLDEFARTRQGVDEMRGIETRFAQALGISKHYWSALKSGKRQIGATLARQFEVKFAKPLGWLDQAGMKNARLTPATDDEWALTTLLLTAYRLEPAMAREAMTSLLEAVLQRLKPSDPASK